MAFLSDAGQEPAWCRRGSASSGNGAAKDAAPATPGGRGRVSTSGPSFSNARSPSMTGISSPARAELFGADAVPGDSSTRSRSARSGLMESARAGPEAVTSNPARRLTRTDVRRRFPAFEIIAAFRFLRRPERGAPVISCTKFEGRRPGRHASSDQTPYCADERQERATDLRPRTGAREGVGVHHVRGRPRRVRVHLVEDVGELQLPLLARAVADVRGADDVLEP
jgi:hypothetical protein